MSKTLHFDVSSGLKSVLGSELITDDDVAIFELVKNSFDALASHVDLFFGDGKIVISDNGVGMTMEDVRTKWLFVGFSSKRERNRTADFRDSIASRRHFAGSKGVGRLSSDRLGRYITLQTRAKREKLGSVHQIKVDWDLFDKDHSKHFEEVKVAHMEVTSGFELPQGLHKIKHGTIITIDDTRKEWDRASILRLKSALAKLINPFGSSADGFKIKIHAPAELEGDKTVARKAHDMEEEVIPSLIVNGEVGNFIFATLQEKTTFIKVRVDESGKHLDSSLTDRGELIYRIREPNRYKKLVGSSFSCELYFLNASAKQTFAKRMGVNSVGFGSVFLFRNGFRVFPIGEDGDDWFKMDRRKGQGYARFLGTRDVIGRIDVEGSDVDFSEASSRDKGLIETTAVQQLRECFMDCCLKRLERYVVPVTFPDTEDKFASDVSRLLTAPGKARISLAVAKLVDNDEIELLEYNRRLISLINERSSDFESSISSLTAIAHKTKDRALFQKVELARKRFEELKKSEAAALARAEEERLAKEEARLQAEREKAARDAAEAKTAKSEEEKAIIAQQLEEEQKRSLFLTSISSLDTTTILNLHHQVTIYSVDIHQQIENLIVALSEKKTILVDDILNRLERISLLNSKVLGVAKFATRANFRLESEKIKADLGEYTYQYITHIVQENLTGAIDVTVNISGKGFIQRFKPIDVTIVIDNLISNAKKAKATKVHFEISHPHGGSVHIKVSDNGHGFHGRIPDLNRVFEKGFTTTDGAGLGLFHVQHVLGEMKGTIEAQRGDPKGAIFHIKISK